MLTVQQRAPLTPNQPYPVQVLDAQRTGEPEVLQLKVAHLAAEHRGRRHTVELELPVYPDSLAAEFFTSCGLDVTIGSKLQERDTIGAKLLAAFAGPSGQEVAVAFSKAREESSHDH